MLTGDNAFPLGGGDQTRYLAVEADAGPEMKLTTIRSLRQTGRVTAMIGDGVNDAAALAAADIAFPWGREPISPSRRRYYHHGEIAGGNPHRRGCLPRRRCE